MLGKGETFFTTVGCLDGRSQQQAIEYGKRIFGAKYADAITEAGLVGHFGEYTETVRGKLMVSIDKHHSKGIIVHGHEECAALDAVDSETHKKNVIETARIVAKLIDRPIPVHGIFVIRDENAKWTLEKVYP